MRPVAAVEEEIRLYVHRATTGAITLDEFEDWFAARTWDEDAPLVAEIDHLLAERHLIPADEALEELRRLTETIISEPPVKVQWGSTGTTTVVDATLHRNRVIRGNLELAGR